MMANGPVVDSSLHRRLRAIEASALGGRSIGLVATLSVALGRPAEIAAHLPPVLRQACFAGAAVMAVAVALALANFRRPGGPRYLLLSAGQVALDTLLMVAMVALFAVHDPRTTWPLLAVPIVVAAIRHRLAGAMTVWAVTSACLAAVDLFTDATAVVAHDVFLATGTHLLLALVTGTQSTAFVRQLADLQTTRAALQHQATHDGLTGLPNRARLAEYAAQHTGRAMAVLLLDLDGFKPVNDRLGHAAGDELLRRVAARLSASLRPGDLAGRLGGDEFLVLLPDGDEAVAAAVIARIGDAVREPMQIEGRPVTVGVSIGAAVRPAGAQTGLDALTVEADAAMYDAKARTRGPHRAVARTPAAPSVR